jgi:succinyl-diaminopimelate desuccinylase
VQWLAARGETLDACLVGEPTNPQRLGEMIKIGRRGSLGGCLTVRGIQGHVAYPERACNPIPRLLALLRALEAEPLDGGSAGFQPSRLVVTTVDVGNEASNVIPATARARFNVRFNDRWDAASLEAALRQRLDRVDADHELELSLAGEAFVTSPGALISVLSDAIGAEVGIAPELSTSGGTSDARFIKDLCPVVEFGLISATIHQVDEQVGLADLEALTRVYRTFLHDYFGRR